MVEGLAVELRGLFNWPDYGTHYHRRASQTSVYYTPTPNSPSRPNTLRSYTSNSFIPLYITVSLSDSISILPDQVYSHKLGSSYVLNQPAWAKLGRNLGGTCAELGPSFDSNLTVATLLIPFPST